MPAPAILGMAALGASLGGVVVAVVDFLARFIAKKLAVTAVAVAAVMIVVSAFVTTMYGFAAGVNASVPGEILQYGGLLLPSNVDEAFTILIGARLAKWVYAWNVRIIEWKVKSA